MYVRVHAVPDARKERVVREDERVFSISVKEPAQQNRANARIREILAEHFGVSLGSVQLVTGHRSPSKMYSVDV